MQVSARNWSGAVFQVTAICRSLDLICTCACAAQNKTEKCAARSDGLAVRAPQVLGVERGRDFCFPGHCDLQVVGFDLQLRLCCSL